MKKLLISFVMLAGLFVTAGCDILGGGMIVDWAPVDIYIEAVDADGNSIISPEMPGMTLTYKGDTYSVQRIQNGEDAQTKAYAAILYGLVAQPMYEIDGNTVYHLYFGEINGAADMDEDIVLHWPDGSEDVIHYHCSNHREWPEPKCDRSWKLNGSKHEGNTFRFSGKSIPE